MPFENINVLITVGAQVSISSCNLATQIAQLLDRPLNFGTKNGEDKNKFDLILGWH